jgi:trimethylamine--corrinoid protein Co-methyltransferase
LVAFCDEIVGWLRRYLRKLEISEETLALDLIHEIGPDGNFLETAHTLRHAREDWLPTVFDRFDYHRWAAEGATTLQQRVNQKVRGIIESHRAQPLTEDVVESIDSIVEGGEANVSE